MLLWGCFSLWEARSPPPPLSLPPSARAANGACAEPRGRLRAAMAPAAGCGRVAAVSCLVLCASLLLPRALLPRGGGRTEPGAAPPDGKSPRRAAGARTGLPAATRGCPGLRGRPLREPSGAQRFVPLPGLPPVFSALLSRSRLFAVLGSCFVSPLPQRAASVAESQRFPAVFRFKASSFCCWSAAGVFVRNKSSVKPSSYSHRLVSQCRAPDAVSTRHAPVVSVPPVLPLAWPRL